MPLTIKGYYQFKRGRHYILLNSRMSGDNLLHTALHEFCHYLFDAPLADEGRTLYRTECGDEDDPRDLFADAFALIGMMPLTDLVKFADQDLSENPWLLKLAGDRIVVRANYRM